MGRFADLATERTHTIFGREVCGPTAAFVLADRLVAVDEDQWRMFWLDPQPERLRELWICILAEGFLDALKFDLRHGVVELFA